MTPAEAPTRNPARRSGRLIALAIVATCALVFIAANTHLVYVAFSSQPNCVPHLKEAGAAGTYRAAQSEC
jgi:hypothetical protein